MFKLIFSVLVTGLPIFANAGGGVHGHLEITRLLVKAQKVEVPAIIRAVKVSDPSFTGATVKEFDGPPVQMKEKFRVMKAKFVQILSKYPPELTSRELRDTRSGYKTWIAIDNEREKIFYNPVTYAETVKAQPSAEIINEALLHEICHAPPLNLDEDSSSQLTRTLLSAYQMSAGAKSRRVDSASQNIRDIYSQVHSFKKDMSEYLRKWVSGFSKFSENNSDKDIFLKLYDEVAWSKFEQQVAEAKGKTGIKEMGSALTKILSLGREASVGLPKASEFYLLKGRLATFRNNLDRLSYELGERSIFTQDSGLLPVQNQVEEIKRWAGLITIRMEVIRPPQELRLRVAQIYSAPFSVLDVEWKGFTDLTTPMSFFPQTLYSLDCYKTPRTCPVGYEGFVPAFFVYQTFRLY